MSRTRRGGYTLTKKCTEPGCREMSFSGCDTRKEYLRYARKANTWKCLRHFHGPCWRAWADDLPLGARITVSVRLELPEAD